MHKGTLRLSGLALALAGLCGCCSPTQTLPVASYLPDNVYRSGDSLPADVRRVAVLPIASEDGDWQAADTRLALEPMLLQELIKTKRFEVTPITFEQLRAWTGRGIWRAEDQLPNGLLQELRARTGCDAVLFSRLQRYHPYEPIVISWNFKLIHASETIVWAVNEIFDGSHPEVANAARHYAGKSKESWLESGRDGILLSPGRFSQFTLNALFQTIPNPSPRNYAESVAPR